MASTALPMRAPHEPSESTSASLSSEYPHRRRGRRGGPSEYQVLCRGPAARRLATLDLLARAPAARVLPTQPYANEHTEEGQHQDTAQPRMTPRPSALRRRCDGSAAVVLPAPPVEAFWFAEFASPLQGAASTVYQVLFWM
jgi:hypothetical protein